MEPFRQLGPLAFADITVGVITPLTGPVAAYGEQVKNGAETAAEEINKAGGINGEKIATLPEFYRKLWSIGAAGVTVPIEVRQSGEVRKLDIKSMDRLDYYRLKSTF